MSWLVLRIFIDKRKLSGLVLLNNKQNKFIIIFLFVDKILNKKRVSFVSNISQIAITWTMIVYSSSGIFDKNVKVKMSIEILIEYWR